MLESVVGFLSNYGYAMVFLLMAIESSFIPFPSEIVMIPAGFMAARGELGSATLCVVFGILGSLAGAFVNYYLALWVGRPFLEKYGKYFFIKPGPLDEACRIFNRYGAATTFVCRLIPVIRQLISIPAGISRMKLLPFTAFTALGSGIWSAILCAIGYALGVKAGDMSYAELVEKGKAIATSHLPLVILVAVLCVAAYIVIHKVAVKCFSK